MSESREGFRRWIIVGGIATLAGAIVIGTHARYVAEGPSMEPALTDSQSFLIQRAWLGRTFEPGDIVVIELPDGAEILKRVIAVGGEAVSFREGAVLVDSEPIGGEPFACGEVACVTERIGERRWTVRMEPDMPRYALPPVEIPAGHLFVLGDNRDRSNDSRNPAIGTIPVELVRGRLVWP